jgi:magnesium chelatase accessory protein
VRALPEDWPLREHSRTVAAGGVRWHVQDLGHGPVVLLVHGTGASTHTWRGLAPILARHARVIAPDLPAHGGTPRPRDAYRLGLPGMSEALGALLETLGVRPSLAVGHSAGAAVLARMCLDARIAPDGLASLNGALLEVPGLPRSVFSPLARMLASSGVFPQLFAWRARDPAAVRRLVASTGSQIDDAGMRQYARLVSDPDHVAGVLAMLGQWDLGPLQRDLDRLATPLLLVAAAGDRTVPPSESRRVHRRVPGSELVELPGLGHLAHEEQPQQVARLLKKFAARVAPRDSRVSASRD